jgi:hypothetical protein
MLLVLVKNVLKQLQINIKLCKKTLGLTTHLNVVWRLRKREHVSPHPPYVFMAWCLIKKWIKFYVVALS